MKLDIKKAINRTLDDMSEVAEKVKQNASAGWDKASEFAKDTANNAAELAKDAATKASKGVNSSVEVVNEKLQYKKTVTKACSEIDATVKSIEGSINPNMDKDLAEQLGSLSTKLKDLIIIIKKSKIDNKTDTIENMNMLLSEIKKEKEDLLKTTKNEFNRVQLIKHYNKAINACEDAENKLQEENLETITDSPEE